MADLLRVRDALELYGSMQTQQLSRMLDAPTPLIEAILERLMAMDKVICVEQSTSCPRGKCKICPKKNRDSLVLYQLKRGY